jgi:hypothetical protein
LIALNIYIIDIPIGIVNWFLPTDKSSGIWIIIFPNILSAYMIWLQGSQKPQEPSFVHNSVVLAS